MASQHLLICIREKQIKAVFKVSAELVLHCR